MVTGGIVAWTVIASECGWLARTEGLPISYPRSNLFMAFLQEFRDCHVVYFVDTPRNDDPRNNALRGTASACVAGRGNLWRLRCTRGFAANFLGSPRFARDDESGVG